MSDYKPYNPKSIEGLRLTGVPSDWPFRVVQMAFWGLRNYDLLMYSDIVKVEFDMKGMSVVGKAIVFPDAKI